LNMIDYQEDVVDLSDRSKSLEKVYSARNNDELTEGYDQKNMRAYLRQKINRVY